MRRDLALRNTIPSVVQDVANMLAAVPDAVAACLVGSAVRPYVTSPGDLDFLVALECPDPNATLLDHLNRGVAAQEEESHAWRQQEDTVRTDTAGWNIGVAGIEPRSLEERLRGILAGDEVAPVYRQWAIGGFAAEGLCGDLRDAVILFDRRGHVRRWKKLTTRYPAALRTAILLWTVDELTTKIRVAERAVQEEDQILLECAVQAAVFPAIRGYFALDRVYFRGMRHLTNQLDRFLPERIPMIRALLQPIQGRRHRLSQTLCEFEAAIRPSRPKRRP